MDLLLNMGINVRKLFLSVGKRFRYIEVLERLFSVILKPARDMELRNSKAQTNTQLNHFQKLNMKSAMFYFVSLLLAHKAQSRASS
jgi:hypothetical protein